MVTAACYWPSFHCIRAPEICICFGGVKLQSFTLGVVIRQGCVLSLLFTVYKNWIRSHSWIDEGVTFGNCRISHLLLENDLALLASAEEGLHYAYW